MFRPQQCVEEKNIQEKKRRGEVLTRCDGQEAVYTKGRVKGQVKKNAIQK